MLRLDRSILRIGGSNKGITRSSRVMTEREKMSGNDDKKGKVGNDDKRKKPLKAERETSRITEI